jgi:hypothetical protein
MIFTYRVTEAAPIMRQLMARPKTMGVESELKRALIPTRNYRPVKNIAPRADYQK